MTLVTDPTWRTAPAADFTDAMSAHTSGVVLVTCLLGSRPWGMTVTAFAPVSAEPPTVLVSLGLQTRSAHTITTTGQFGISILAEEHLALARLGSTPGAAKFLEPFVDDDWSTRTPVVAGALAHLDCVVTDAAEVADHTLFIGHVRAAQASHAGTPLLYHRRAYRTFREPRCLSS